MENLDALLSSNKRWAAKIKAGDPTFFERLAEQQSPEYLWIGCSDSRVPATQIVDLEPGEIFVHRNIANTVNLNDDNALAVIQFAVEALQVKHIIVCGHYGCGGVIAADSGLALSGPVDRWLDNVREVRKRHAQELDTLSGADRVTRLCELNVLAQLESVSQIEYVRAARERSPALQLHAWIYDIHDGIIKQLKNL